MPRTRFAGVKTDSRNLITPTTNFAEVKTDYRNFYMPVTPLVRFEFRKSCRRPVEVWRVRFDFHKAHRTSTKRNFRTSTKKFGNSVLTAGKSLDCPFSLLQNLYKNQTQNWLSKPFQDVYTCSCCQNGLSELLQASYTLCGGQNRLSKHLQACNTLFGSQNGLSKPPQASNTGEAKFTPTHVDDVIIVIGLRNNNNFGITS